MLKINMKLPVAVTELLTLPDFVNEHSIRILFFFERISVERARI